jgi:hypothetical protein
MLAGVPKTWLAYSVINKSLELVCVCVRVDRNSHLLGVYCCLLQLSAHITASLYILYIFRFVFDFSSL